MTCPACGIFVAAWMGNLYHAVQCGVLLDTPDDDKWVCICGFHCEYNDQMYQHLTELHDWPRLLTTKALEQM